jgi:hypothetical protein
MYELVKWPEVQELMNEDWFLEEAKLNFEDADSSYFIPINKLYDLSQIIKYNDSVISDAYGKYITQFMEEFKENGGKGNLLWAQKMLGNIDKDTFVNLLKTDSNFIELWGKF